jgi:hypothetical protein
MKQLCFRVGSKCILVCFCCCLLMFVSAGQSFAAPTSMTHHAQSLVPNASLSSIVCGGQKEGSGWTTESSGGYSGQGCGPGIDEHSTPTTATSWYFMGYADANVYDFEAWIPTNYAVAHMDFALVTLGCGDVEIGDSGTLDESQLYGWTDLFKLNGSAWDGCDIWLEAWTGTVYSHNPPEAWGLDAVESCVTGSYCSNCYFRCGQGVIETPVAPSPNSKKGDLPPP